jgi:hypothetical protein
MYFFKCTFNFQRLTFLILFTSIFCANPSNAISDFRKGYILKSENDSVWGLIKYSQGPKSNRICIFKESDKGQTTRYSSNDIVGYGFMDDKKYISRQVQTIGNEVQIYFLEVLVNGSFSLLNLDNSFYVLNKENELIKLINIKAENQSDRLKNQTIANHYAGILNLLMFDCIELRDQIPKTRYSEKMLTRIVEQYHECKKLPFISYKNQKPWIKTDLGVLAGFQHSTIKFITPGIQYQHMTGDFSTAQNPVAGISLDISSPRVNERLSLISSILYTAPSYYSYRHIDNGAYIQNDYVSVSLHSIKIPAGFRYTFPEKSITPYFNAGFVSIFNVSSSSDYYSEYRIKDEVWVNEPGALKIKSYQFGYWGGIGIQKTVSPKYSASVEMRFEKADMLSHGNIVKMTDYMSSVSNFQVLITLKTR